MKNKKITLSDKQAEIIRVMRNDYRLFKNVTYAYIRYGRMKLSTATFKVLLRHNLIKEKGARTQFGWEYVLTELGKTIKL